MAEITNGSDLMLFIDTSTTETPSYEALAFATSCKVSISAETVETSSKDSGGKWVKKQVKKLSWNMSSENLYAVEGKGLTYDDLFDLMVARKEIPVVFAVESGYKDKADEVPTDGWKPTASGQKKGKVIITSLEANAPDGDNATYSATFEGVGPLTKVA